MSKNIRIFGFTVAICLSIVSGKRANADNTSPHSSLFDNVSLSYSNIVQGINFPYYSQAERIQTITDLVLSIQSDYSLLLYKQHTLGVDIVQIGTAALAVEQAIPDVLTVNEQAAGNLQFLDRVRKITANFQDSHFQLDAAQSPSAMALGFVISNISGKYLVTSLRPNYLTNTTLKFDYSPQIAIGDEVVSIDGQDPLSAAQALKPYIPASSDLYRTNSAIFSLTGRDFALPTQAAANIVLRRNGSTTSLNLPWGAVGATRSDEATYLKNIGVPIALQSLALDSTSPFVEGWRTKIGALKNQLDFADASDPTTRIITIGTLDSPSGPVGYLQIQTFMISAIIPYQAPVPAAQASPAPSSASAKILSSLAALPTPKQLPNLKALRTIMDSAPKPAGFFPVDSSSSYLFPAFVDIVIAAFKSKSMPLILDIRYNPGGEIGDASMLVSDLAPTKGSIAPLSQMFRITNLAWESVDAAVASGMEDPANLDPDAQEVSAVFTEARANSSLYSEVLPASPLVTDKAVSGYDQKIVVLTSSFCVSACDATALLLKTSGRATVMGEPTNGTGGGFFSTFDVPDFTDTNHIIAAHLPNFLFGRPLVKGEDPKTVSVESVEAENHPTEPDVLIQSSLADVQNGNSDLITAAIAKVTSAN